MIRAVSGHGGGEAAFLAAANAQPLPGIELASAWYALGKGQPRGAHGWHFFTAGEDEAPFALALRRGTAWACGPHDPEELGEFLRCVGASRFTARLRGGDDPSFAACPGGFAVAERMLGFVRPYEGAGRSCAAEGAELSPWAADAFRSPAGHRLAEERDAARIAGFLRQEGAFAAPAGVCAPAVPGRAEEGPEAAEEQAQQAAACLFAQELDARAAVGLGYAAVLEEAAAPHAGPDPETTPPRIAAVMAVSTAPHAGMVCLSALQTRAEMRGQGLGGRMVRALAAGAGHSASGVCLLCRPERAGFYTRLGFVPEGEYACFVPAR